MVASSPATSRALPFAMLSLAVYLLCITATTSDGGSPATFRGAFGNVSSAITCSGDSDCPVGQYCDLQGKCADRMCHPTSKPAQLCPHPTSPPTPCPQCGKPECSCTIHAPQNCTATLQTSCGDTCHASPRCTFACAQCAGNHQQLLKAAGCGNDAIAAWCSGAPDPCQGVSCNGHGSCSDLDGKCVCSGGYSGSTCQYDPCHGVSCGSHGSCRVSGSSHTCACTGGYSGSTCQYDPCHGVSCGSHGSCRVSGSSHTCAC
eukprot:COSAG06_NODE_172_length_21346_cov_503.127053_1_plen_259_part_10